MCIRPLTPPSAFSAHSRRSWVTFASHCVTSPLLANLQSVFWRPRTWRKWMWEGCQVHAEASVWCCKTLFIVLIYLFIYWKNDILASLMWNLDACSRTAAYERASLRAQPLGCSCSARMLTLQYLPCTSSRSPLGFSTGPICWCIAALQPKHACDACHDFQFQIPTWKLTCCRMGRGWRRRRRQWRRTLWIRTTMSPSALRFLLSRCR